MIIVGRAVLGGIIFFLSLKISESSANKKRHDEVSSAVSAVMNEFNLNEYTYSYNSENQVDEIYCNDFVRIDPINMLTVFAKLIDESEYIDKDDDVFIYTDDGKSYYSYNTTYVQIDKTNVDTGETSVVITYEEELEKLEEYSKKNGPRGNCTWCNGTGKMKYYYGASALEAAMDGYDDYDFYNCAHCHGTGRE